MAGSGRRWAREQEMRGVLARWERSGLALSRFADREGMSRKTLYRWRRRTGVGGERLQRGRRPKAYEVGESSEPPARFTEVSSGLRLGWSSGVSFEVVLSDGTSVRVRDHFDADSLRILLHTLREC